MNDDFKICGGCGHRWATRLDMLSDPQVSLCAYQADFTHLEEGQFLFNHSCGSTFAIPAKQFRDLYAGPVFAICQRGSDQCTGKCMHSDDLTTCPAKCDCAYVREILQIVRFWPKKPAPGHAA